MIEILKYIIPSLVMLLATWLVMQQFYRNEEKKRLFELKRESQKTISPIRLRAYERLTILLERTTPEHMLIDMDITQMTILEMQQHLLRTVRTEFDHNLSQQVYVSNEVWDKITNAKDQMGGFISAIAAQMPKNATGLDYAKALITAYTNNGDTPHSVALESLKEEAKTLF